MHILLDKGNPPVILFPSTGARILIQAPRSQLYTHDVVFVPPLEDAQQFILYSGTENECANIIRALHTGEINAIVHDGTKREETPLRRTSC